MTDVVPVRVRLDGAGVGSVEVAGTDVSHNVRGVSFRTYAGDIPHVELELLPRAFELDAEARVQVDRDAHAVLVALGWTPPRGSR